MPALKWGYINTAGDVIIPLQYSDAKGFSEHLAAVRSGNMWGYIDLAGRWVVKPMFADTEDFHEGVALVREGQSGAVGYIDTSGKLASPAPSDRRTVLDFKDGVSLVYDVDSRSSSLIDRNGRVITKGSSYPPGYEFDRVGRDSFVVAKRTTGLKLLGEGLAAYGDTYIGPLDSWTSPAASSPRRSSKPSPVLEFPGCGEKGWVLGLHRSERPHRRFPFFDSAGEFYDGLAVTRSKGRFGYVDRTGRSVIKPAFVEACSFSDGLAYACVETGIFCRNPSRKGTCAAGSSIREALSSSLPVLRGRRHSMAPGPLWRILYSGGRCSSI